MLPLASSCNPLGELDEPICELALTLRFAENQPRGSGVNNGTAGRQTNICSLILFVIEDWRVWLQQYLSCLL